MSRGPRRRWLIAAVPLLLAGCGSAQAAGPAGHTRVPTHKTSTSPSNMSEMKSGTDMPGMKMPGMKMPALAASPPSAASRMICNAGTRRDVATLVKLAAPPHPVSSWTDRLYTCTYHLPGGPLIISVKESTSKPTAMNYFRALRERTSGTRTLTGMASFGLPAFQAANGTVAFVKDDKTLLVDPTALPSTVSDLTRSEFGYTVASDILGCWSGG